MANKRAATSKYTNEKLDQPRMATAEEFLGLQKFGLPSNALQQHVWLNVVKNPASKNNGRLYWTWGESFLFWADKPYPVHKQIAIGRLEPFPAQKKAFSPQPKIQDMQVDSVIGHDAQEPDEMVD